MRISALYIHDPDPAKFQILSDSWTLDCGPLSIFFDHADAVEKWLKDALDALHEAIHG